MVMARIPERYFPLLGASALVVPSDAPDVVKDAAWAMKLRMGDLVVICSGVQDWEKIQPVIDAVSAAGGGLIQFLGGNFHLGATPQKVVGGTRIYVNIKAGVILQGLGYSTVFDCQDTGDPLTTDIVLFWGLGERIALRDMKIVLNQKNHHALGVHASHALVDRVWCYDGEEQIGAANVEDVIVMRCLLQKSGAASIEFISITDGFALFNEIIDPCEDEKGPTISFWSGAYLESNLCKNCWALFNTIRGKYGTIFFAGTDGCGAKFNKRYGTQETGSYALGIDTRWTNRHVNYSENEIYDVQEFIDWRGSGEYFVDGLDLHGNKIYNMYSLRLDNVRNANLRDMYVYKPRYWEGAIFPYSTARRQDGIDLSGTQVIKPYGRAFRIEAPAAGNFCRRICLDNFRVLDACQGSPGSYDAAIKIETGVIDLKGHGIESRCTEQNITSNLTAEAPLGQKNCIVAATKEFEVGQNVEIKDDAASEYNKIASIVTATKTLTMENNLANTYTVAANGLVRGRMCSPCPLYSEAAGADYKDCDFRDNIAPAYITGATPVRKEPVVAKTHLIIPVVAGWTPVLVNSGTHILDVNQMTLRTGATANSSSLLYTFARSLAAGVYIMTRVNWDVRMEITFNFARNPADTEAVSYFQLKEANTIGALAAKGIGLRINNMSLVGESFGTELGEVDLATTLSANKDMQIKIIHNPGKSIEWWIGGLRKGIQTSTTKIPSGEAGADSYFVVSHASGPAAGNTWFFIYNPIDVQQDR